MLQKFGTTSNLVLLYIRTINNVNKIMPNNSLWDHRFMCGCVCVNQFCLFKKFDEVM